MLDIHTFFLFFVAKNRSQLNVTVKPINDFVVGQEISDIKLHRSGEKVAVLCPFQEKIHIIQLRDLVATHSFVIAGGARRMIWYKKCLVTATRKTGVIQVFSTQSGREKYNNTGETRRIHVFAVYGNLIATGEENLCKVYKQEELSDEIAWPVTKKYLTAICMNDVLLITGSRTGTIKIWSLIEVFTMKPGTSPVPLTKLSANNMREFGAFTTIKSIHQVKYTEIVVVSEYKHGRRFNRFTSTDKVKVIKLAKEGDDQAASPPLYLPGRC